MSTFGHRIRGLIERALGWASSTVSSAVLLREAARTSRRWQTYAARLGFSGVLIGGLLMAIWAAVASPFADPASLGWLGRGLFVGVATLQFALALMLAPLTCASAIAEETDQGTLDLLVLTRLHAHQIVGAKVLSRILVLLTLVFGALPVTTVVVTLGGVSGTEVLAVTAHTALAVILAGGMGALFSMFTRSPLLAMAAAAGYAVPSLIVIPATYAILSGSWRAFTHLSLLGGPAAQGPDAFLALIAHAPVIWLVWRYGTRLFSLRISRAHIRKAFSGELWETSRYGMLFGGLLLVGFFLVPITSVPLWALRASKTAGAEIVVVGLQGLLFLWSCACTWLAGWIYLRVGVDVVDAIDRTFGTGRRETRPPVAVWDNPVAWREARPRAWGASAVPIQFTWLLGVLLLSQSTLWIIPGGLVGLGLFNLAAAILLTLWLATWTIEQERRVGSLEVLLTTTLPSWRIVLGKVAGIALPTLPLIAISLPLLVLGNAYAEVVFDQSDNPFVSAFNGFTAWIWAIGVWAIAVFVGMLAALRSRKRSAFAIACGTLGFALGVPTAAGRLFADIPLIAEPARVLAPPLAGDPAFWQVALSTFGVLGLAVVLFGTVTLNLRRWGTTGVALLALGLAAVHQPAMAQSGEEIEKQGGFVFDVRPLNDGVGREDQWTALQVSVINTQGKATGVISIEERPPGDQSVLPYRRTLELPEKSRKDVLLLVRPGIATRPRAVNLVAGPRRQATAEVQWQHVDDHGVVLGVIGDDPLGVTAIGQAWTGPVPGKKPSTWSEDPRTVRGGLLDPRLLPRHSAAYDAIDQIVWHRADPTQIGARELDTLLHWVASGGHLTITVTDTWKQVADSPLGDALPVDLVGTRDAPQLDNLVAALGLSGNPTGPTPQALAVPRRHPDRGAWVVAADNGGYAQWSIGSYGLGTVTVLAVDPETEPLASMDRIGLWRALLWLPRPQTENHRWRAKIDGAKAYGADEDHPPSLLAALRVWEAAGYECYWNNGWQELNAWDMHDPRSGWEMQLREKLNNIPGASPLPLSWLIAFSLLYLVMIGPVDFFVLRRLRKEPWTWVTFPLTVVVFSGVALVGTAYTKGSEAVVTRVETIDILPGTDRWRGQTALGVFSTRKTDLVLGSGPADGVIAPLEDGGSMWTPAIEVDEGPARLHYRAETWTLAYAQSTWVEAGHGRFRVVDTDDGPALENATGFPLADVVLIEGDPTARTEMERTLEIGPMAVGERVPIGEVAGWTARQPSGEDLRFAWRALRDQPESVGAHLHPPSYRWTVLAVSEKPVEDIALTGLSPIEQNLTVFRAPLGPPVAPGRPAWNEDLP